MTSPPQAPLRRSILDQMLRWPVRRPGTMLALGAVVAALAIASSMRLQPSGSLEAMMDRGDPSAVALGRILRDFGSIDHLLVVATLPHDAPAASAVLSRFAQRVQREVEDDLELRAAARQVRVAAGPTPQEREFFEKHVIPSALYYLDDAEFERLLTRLSAESMRQQLRRTEDLMAAPGPAAAELGRLARRDPLRLRTFFDQALEERGLGDASRGEGDDNLLLSRDRRSLLIRIAGALPASNLDFTRMFMARMRGAVERANVDGLRVEYSGSYAIAAASEGTIRGDMIRSVVGAIVLMQIVFLVMHRMMLAFVVAFAPTALAIVTAFGVYGFVGRELTPATAAVGAIIAGLGIDYSVHVLSHYAHARQGEQPVAAADAAHATLATLLRPMVAAAATTMVGVLAIAQSPVRALRDFTAVALLGLAAALLATFTLLPALLVVIERMSRFGARFSLAGLTRWIDHRARSVLFAGSLMWIAAVAFLGLAGGELAPIETDLAVMHPRPNPALDLQPRIPLDFDVPANTLLVHLEADSPAALTALAHRVEAAARTQEMRAAGVRGVWGLATLLPDPSLIEARRAKIAKIDVDQVLANFRAAVDQSMLWRDALADFEEFLASLLRAKPPPDLKTLAGYPALACTVLPSGAPAAPHQAISIVMLERPLADTAARDRLIRLLRAALDDIQARRHGAATLTGLSVISHQTERSIFGDLARLPLIAAAAVITLLAIYLRNLWHLLLVLMPTVCGLTAIALGLRLFDDRLNMINIVGIPMLMGIGDNFGLFVVDAYRRQRGERAAPGELASHLAPSVHAIILTSATAILGFGSLMFTSTPAIQSLGRLTALGIAACLGCTLLVVMPLTLLLSRRGGTP